MAALAQQEARKLLACPPQCVRRVETGPYQIAHRLMCRIRDPDLQRRLQPKKIDTERIRKGLKRLVTRHNARSVGAELEQ